MRVKYDSERDEFRRGHKLEEKKKTEVQVWGESQNIRPGRKLVLWAWKTTPENNPSPRAKKWGSGCGYGEEMLK